jgi:hypothetical protein
MRWGLDTCENANTLDASDRLIVAERSKNGQANCRCRLPNCRLELSSRSNSIFDKTISGNENPKLAIANRQLA